VIGVRIDLAAGDPAAARRVGSALAPARIHPVIGKAAANVFTRHLRGLNRTRPNQLGSTNRTNYYAAAARGTSFVAESDGATVSIAQIGIRQRFFGGTIRPKAALVSRTANP
jgi:hypothetical protein